jgi:UDP-glucuronate 4-epimerase
MLSLVADTDYEIFNLGNSKPVNTLKVVMLLAKYLGKKPLVKYENAPNTDILKTFADISETKDLLGIEPKTKIEEGLKRFADWFKVYLA